MTKLEKAMQQMCTPGLWEATINFCYQNSNKKEIYLYDGESKAYNIIVRTGISPYYVEELLTGIQIPIIYQRKLKEKGIIEGKIINKINRAYGVVLNIYDKPFSTNTNYEFQHQNNTNEFYGPFNKYYSLDKSKTLVNKYQELHPDYNEFKLELEEYLDKTITEMNEYIRREQIIRLNLKK